MNTRSLWSRILVIIGSIAILLGAIDPLEGSVVILAGSARINRHLPRPSRPPFAPVLDSDFPSHYRGRQCHVRLECNWRHRRKQWIFHVVGSPGSALSRRLDHGHCQPHSQADQKHSSSQSCLLTSASGDCGFAAPPLRLSQLARATPSAQ